MKSISYKEMDPDLQDMFGSNDSDEDRRPNSPQGKQHDQDLLDMFGSPSCDDGTPHSGGPSSNTEQRACTSGNEGATAETKESLRRKRVAQAILIQNQKKKVGLKKAPPAIMPCTSDRKRSATATKKNAFFRSVDMEHYWKNLLEWDFIRDLNDSCCPNLQTNATQQQMEPLPDTFETSQEYKARWSPLLLQEVRSQILSEVQSEMVPLWSRGASLQPIRVETSCVPTNNKERTLLLRTVQGQSGEVQATFVDTVFLLVQDAQSLVDAAQGKLVSNANKKRFGILGLAMNRTQTLDGLRIKVSFRQWQEVGKRDMVVARIGSNVTGKKKRGGTCCLNVMYYTCTVYVACLFTISFHSIPFFCR